MHKTIILAVALMANMALFAQSGILDADFGDAGLVITDVPGNNDISSRVKLQTDGKIVMGGRCDEGPLPDMFIARYDTLGVHDPDFGTDGIAVSSLSYFTTFADFNLQSDGKLLVLGNAIITPGEFDFALLRLNADGSVDSDFGTDGAIFVDIDDTTNLGEAVLELPDNKIVVLGHIGGGGITAFSYSRLNSDGSPDADFGGGDGHEVSPVDVPSVIITRAERRADGKIFVVGYGIPVETVYESFVACFNEDGTLNTDFGTDGIAWVDISMSNFYSFDLALQTDNKILFIGTYTDDVSGDTNMKVVRLKSNGDYDPEFGDAGKVTIDLEGNEESGTSIVLQTDNKILIGGHSNINGDRDYVLMRLESNGDIDNLFGTDGLVLTDFAGGDDKALDIALQENNKIIQGGQVNNGGLRIGAARFENDVDVGTHIGENTIQHFTLYPNPATTSIIISHSGEFNYPLQISLSDISGKRIITATIVQVAGNIVFNLPSHLPQGLYCIQLTDNSKVASQMLFVE